LAEIDPVELMACLREVANKGGALRLGLTRDGGALAIGIYGDGNMDPYTEYLRPGEDAVAYFRGLAIYFDELPNKK